MIEECPMCNEEVVQVEADVGVGIIYGPAHCTNQECGWNDYDYFYPDDSADDPRARV